MRHPSILEKADDDHKLEYGKVVLRLDEQKKKKKKKRRVDFKNEKTKKKKKKTEGRSLFPYCP